MLPVSLPLVAAVSSLRVALPDDLRPADRRRAVLLSLRDVAARYPDGLPALDPVDDVGVVGDPELEAALADAKAATELLAGNEVYRAERDAAKFQAFAEKAQVLSRAQRLREELRGSNIEALRDEMARRGAVMRRLGFLDDSGIVTLKGQAAACVDTADELLAAELMFNGVFKRLDKHQLAALASCLVPVEKTNDEIALAAALAEPLAQLQLSAKRIAEVSNECRVEVDAEAYVESFRPTLMDVVHRWSRGASFAEVCSLTELYEGSIIRAVRRLDELLAQLGAAAAEVGDGGLQALFGEAQASIRRDIVFAASLYI